MTNKVIQLEVPRHIRASIEDTVQLMADEDLILLHEAALRELNRREQKRRLEAVGDE